MTKPQLKNLRSRAESLIAAASWIFIWICFISIQINKTPGEGHFLLKSSGQIRALFGPGDAGSLLEIATAWSNFQSLDPITQYWIVRLWSPGLPIIEIPMIWAERLGIPIYLSFIGVILFSWGIAFYLFWRYFSPLIGRRISLSIAALTYLSWDFNYFFVEGLFNSEGFGYCLFIISFLGLSYNILFADALSMRYPIVFGIVFGISIWVRHTSDITLIFESFTLLILFVFKFILTLRKNGTKKQVLKMPKIKDFNYSNLRTVFIFFGVAFLVTLPWRIISPTVFGGAEGLMTSGGGVIANNVWASPASESGRYWGVYGSNWACQIDRRECLRISENVQNGNYSSSELMLLATKVAVLNPKSYLTERFKYAIKFSNPLSIAPQSFGRYLGLLNFGFFLLIFFFVKIPKSSKITLMIIWIPFIIFTIFQLMWIHFEPRYFIPLRIGLFGMFLSTLAVIRKLQCKENSNKIENF